MRKNKTVEIGALRIFATVADSETLTLAGQRLGISQSAVSQAIKQLEELTEVELLVRRSRPIKLTQGGHVLNSYANRILSDTSRMINEIKLASEGGLSELKVGMIDSFGDALGLQFVNEIKPLVSKVALRTGFTTRLSKALIDRDIDILITSDPFDTQSDLTRYALICDPFLVIVPKSIKETNPKITDIASSLPFIHYAKESQIGIQTDLIARRIGVELNTQYELDSTQTLMRFVAEGQGWAIISALCLARYPKLLENIRVIDLNNGANTRTISLLCRTNELGKLPEKISEISRALFTREVVPRLEQIAPWLAEQAYAIEKVPKF